MRRVGELAAGELLLGRGDTLGEGPLWDYRNSTLIWIDIEAGRVRSSKAGVETELISIDGKIGSVALASDGALLLATTNGLLLRKESGELELLANPDIGFGLRFNDGRVDRHGRFWVGTMPLDPADYGKGLGGLWRVDTDGSNRQILDGLTIANGLDWSPDGCTFYLTDTERRQILAFDTDLDTGDISGRRVFAEIDPAHGYPDGLVVDSEGFVWSVGITGGVICRYNREGEQVASISLPMSCPTAACFGGGDFSQMYITSSQHLLPSGHDEELAGCVIAIDAGAKGRAASIYGESNAS